MTVGVVSIRDLVAGHFVDAAGRLANHEAGHAAVACFVGLHVESATIAGSVRDAQPGHVRLVPTDPCEGHLLACLAGPITDGQPLEWPPLDMGDDSDEATAAAYVAKFELGYEAWCDEVDLTRAMLETRSVMRARSAIAAQLYEHGTLDGAEVHRIAAEAFASAAPSSGQVEEDL